MKTALLAAAALLGTGCIIVTDDGKTNTTTWTTTTTTDTWTTTDTTPDTVITGDTTPTETAPPPTETTTAPPPAGSATLAVYNYTGYDVYYLYHCSYDDGTCYDALGSSILPDGSWTAWDFEPGLWWTIAVDEDDLCLDTGLVDYWDGDLVYWDLYEMLGIFDWIDLVCYYY